MKLSYLVIGGIVIILFIIGSLLRKEKPTKSVGKLKPKTAKERMDSLIIEMLKDKEDLGIKTAFYNQKDSTLKIACDIDKRDRKHYGTTTTFDLRYNTDNLPVNFTKVYFYEKNGNHFGKMFSFTSNKFSKMVADFKKEYCYSNECRPLTIFIQKSMNDPNSFEADQCEVFYNDKMNDTLIVDQIFRGKNAFGGLVLNKVEAVMDKNGNVLSIHKFE